MSEPRSINELVDLPYSEMTEEEINILVEWKAANLARDEAHQRAIEAIQARSAEMVNALNEMAEENRAVLNEMRERARERYRKASE